MEGLLAVILAVGGQPFVAFNQAGLDSVSSGVKQT